MTLWCAAAGRRPRRRDSMGILHRVTASLVMALGTATAQPTAPTVHLIPLDDRPTSLHVPVALGAIGGVRVVTPPRALLGRFSRPADADAVAAWLRRESARPAIATVVSLDLLAYGGLVASRRIERATREAAIARLETLRAVRAAIPARPLYAFATLMRLAPTADGTDEPYREAIARWAELATDTATAATSERHGLEARIPAELLTRYRAARARNLAVAAAALRLVADGVIDHLVLAQDDARPRGIHLAERDTLRAWIAARGVGARVSLQPGTDEVGMLLIARAIAASAHRAPTIRVTYADPADSARMMPFEDRPLDETVSAALATTGARRTDASEAEDLHLIVHTARLRPVGTADAVRLVTQSGRPVILADVDPTGRIQGADTLLTDQLVATGRFAELAAYAAWNTAGNAIGTAVAHGVLRWIATTTAGAPNPARERAHRAMLLERLLDDDVYHSRLRPGIVAALRAHGADPFRLPASTARATEVRLQTMLTARLPWALTAIAPAGSRCRLARPLRVTLPWDRPFEAELDLQPSCG